MTPEDFTLEQLAGQRLMVGFDGTALTRDLEFFIRTLKVAGIVLFSQNVSGPEQVTALCADAQAAARACGQPPLLIAIDQEGGPVARLKPPFTVFPGNPAMTGKADAERFARITAAELGRIGVNMNLAPVMDVAFADMDSVMANRAFGSDPRWVARLGTAVIDGLQRSGTMAVAKHFPGIGRTTLDSHLTQPVLDAAVSVMAATDFLPFEGAIARGVAGIMLSHILYRDLDAQWPASLSVRIARDLLRQRMGYAGVVMTDDLDMRSIRSRYDMATVMRRVIRADIDLALICHQGPDTAAGFEALCRELSDVSAARDRGRMAAGRVLALKKRYLAP